jgi:hypothetical protein
MPKPADIEVGLPIAKAPVFGSGHAAIQPKACDTRS